MTRLVAQIDEANTRAEQAKISANWALVIVAILASAGLVGSLFSDDAITRLKIGAVGIGTGIVAGGLINGSGTDSKTR